MCILPLDILFFIFLFYIYCVLWIFHLIISWVLFLVILQKIFFSDHVYGIFKTCAIKLSSSGSNNISGVIGDGKAGITGVLNRGVLL